MPSDIKIDPATRDFVDSPDGGWIEVDDSSTAVMVQLDSRLGRWWGDRAAGSKNKEIMESDLPTIEEIQDSTRRALQQMARAGLISDVFVLQGQIDEADGDAELLIQWRDRASNKPADLAYSPLGGHP